MNCLPLIISELKMAEILVDANEGIDLGLVK